MRVEITPITGPADPATVAKRADIAQRLENLGHIDASAGEVNTVQNVGWTATIDGTPISVDGFAIEQDGDRVLLSLAVSPDEISIRQTPTPQASLPTLAEKREQRSTWGDRAQPDPREGIPGWEPEPESLGAQVARNAEVSA